MQQFTVSGLAIDSVNDSPVVLLKEQDGDRVIPVWIGPAEANAIALKLADVEPPRPLTHDLLKRVIDGAGLTVQHVIISDIVGQTYYAEIVLEGKMPPKTRAMEGPFGEYTGYYGSAHQMPIIRLEAITQRADPIYQATYTGKPVKEEHIMTSVCGPEGDPPPPGWRAFTYHAYRFMLGINRRLTKKPIRLPDVDVERVTGTS